MENESYYLEKIAEGSFQFTFTKPIQDVSFKLITNKIETNPYILQVSKVPTIFDFQMVLNYPKYMQKKSEIIRMKNADDKDAFTFDIETNHGKKTIAISNPPVKEVNAIRMELEHFRDAILLDKPIPVSEVDGLRAMDVAHQILQKIQRATVA